MNEENRYVQPQNAKEAMELIQKLFNQYRNAPLTAELLQYLHDMTELMRRWTTIRLSGRPFTGKMRHFHFVANNGQKFKRQVHKMGGSSAHRASRH